MLRKQYFDWLLPKYIHSFSFRIGKPTTLSYSKLKFDSSAQPNEELPQPKIELFFKCIKKNCINSFFFLFLSFYFLLFYLKILSLPSKFFQKQEGFVIYTTQQTSGGFRNFFDGGHEET